MKRSAQVMLLVVLSVSMVLTVPAVASYHGGSGGWQPAPEFDGGCEVAGTAHVGAVAGRSRCTYLSHGPGQAIGWAPSGWCVNIFRNYVRVNQYCHDWQNVYTKTLQTQEGDVVELFIAEFCFFYGAPYRCDAGMYPGFVRAGDV